MRKIEDYELMYTLAIRSLRDELSNNNGSIQKEFEARYNCKCISEGLSEYIEFEDERYYNWFILQWGHR